MFALFVSLQDTSGAMTAVGLSDAALQAFALTTREIGRVMSFFSSGLSTQLAGAVDIDRDIL